MNKEIYGAILVALFAASILYSSQIDSTKANELTSFEEFQRTYQRSYTRDQKIFRFKIFADNLVKIDKHNSDESQTYKMGITEFADMTPEQFVGQILMMDLADKISPYTQRQGFVGKAAPSSVDWRDKPVLNAVKNQGQCGSCWAFSTTGVLESNIAVATGKLNNFSEQQLVDCCGDKGYECQGCNGAWPEWALNYINSAGIVQQNQYTYTAVKGKCKDTSTAKKFLNSVKPWTIITQSDTAGVKNAVGSVGPVSICVDASNWSLYRSGVFSNCGIKVLNHAVLLVGYQEDNTWIVRNSWGATWGEKGYIRLSTGNTCGLAEHAVLPNLA